MTIYATNMDMGVHRFTFKQEHPGYYTAQGILPTCAEGGMLWVAEIKGLYLHEDQAIGGAFGFKTDR